MQQSKRPFQSEVLSVKDCYNEYIMTGLRTMWGVSTLKIEQEFGKKYALHLKQQAQKHIENGVLECVENTFHLTFKGKFLGDGIASDLFFLSLNEN